MIKKDIKKLDTLWSKKVKEKYDYICQGCLSEGVRLESAHIIGRSYRTTRWGVWLGKKYDLNGLPLCHTCHRSYDQHLPPMYLIILNDVISIQRFQSLHTVSKVIAKYQDPEQIKQWIEEA